MLVVEMKKNRHGTEYFKYLNKHADYTDDLSTTEFIIFTKSQLYATMHA